MEGCYHSKKGNIEIMVHATPAAAASTLAKAVYAASESAITAKGSFTIVLAGGSLPSSLAALLSYKDTVQWDKFHVFFVDERNVAHSSPDSNLKAANEAILSKVPIPSNQVYGIKENAAVHEAALDYEQRLASLPVSVLPRNSSGIPIFDLMLLGVGPDGHIASLFPHHALLAEAKKWVLPVTDSPKPPPERITMSLPVINAAKEVIFVALGEGKADIVQQVLEGQQALPGALPAQLVQLSVGRVRWLLDTSARSLHSEAWTHAS